jgi:hypothetical protein
LFSCKQTFEGFVGNHASPPPQKKANLSHRESKPEVEAFDRMLPRIPGVKILRIKDIKIKFEKIYKKFKYYESVQFFVRYLWTRLMQG